MKPNGKNHKKKNRIVSICMSMVVLILISTISLALVNTASAATFTLGIEKLIGTGVHPSIATSPVDGTMHVVYVNNGLRYRSYNPTTGSLGTEELVASGEIWWPQVAVSGDGDVHVVWEQSPMKTYIGYARRISGVWKSAGNLNPDSLLRAMMPRIDVDKNNRAHVVFWQNIKGGTLPRGQYNRINKVSGSLRIELTKDISGWDGNRPGDIVIDSNNIPHVFSGQVDYIRHWTVSESGTLSSATSLLKPSGIEKFMEGMSVATGAGGKFYGFSRDAGLGKEVFNTRDGGPSRIVWNSPNIGVALVAAGDLAVNGRAYVIFADTNKKGRVAAIDADGTVTGPILFAGGAGNQHDGVERHSPGGVGVAGGGLYVVYQDDRSGTWQVYIRKVSTGNAPGPAPTPAPTSITVTFPNGGENWAIGSTQTIKWTFSGSTGTDVKIELLKAGAAYMINSNTPNDGSYSWTVPATQTPGSDYKIRVTSTSNSAYTDTSNNYFTISSSTPPNPSTSSITVVSPNGGENLARGTTQTVKWTSSGSTGTDVKIELLKDGVRIMNIRSSVANTGSYSWTIPATLSAGGNYKVTVRSTSNSAYADTSDNGFTISSSTSSTPPSSSTPSITVVSPNGGEILARGTTQTVKWTSSGSTGTDVKIELLKDGVRIMNIRSSVANTGSYSWTIPATLSAGGNYKVTVRSTSNSAYTDLSNNYFTIR